MANKCTDAQIRASMKYQQARAQVKITVSKEQRAKYQALAKDKGISLTGLIVKLLEQECGE